MARLVYPDNLYRLNLTGRYRPQVSPGGLIMPDNMMFGPDQRYVYRGAMTRDQHYKGEKTNVELYAGRRALYPTDAYPIADLSYEKGVYMLGGKQYAWPNVPGASFSRSSAATAIDETGRLITFASGVPRLTGRGLLIEAGATNLAKNSNSFTNGTYWTRFNAANIATSQILGPDALTTACLLTITNPADQDDGGSLFTQTTSGMDLLAANTTYTASLWARCLSGTYAFSLGWYGNTGTPEYFAYSSDFTVTTVWQRFSYTFTTANVSFSYNNMGIAPPATLASCAIYIWGYQLELGSVATSNILTTNATATRASDSYAFAFSGAASAADLSYEGGSASLSTSSPIDLGASSGGAWVGKNIKQLILSK